MMKNYNKYLTLLIILISISSLKSQTLSNLLYEEEFDSSQGNVTITFNYAGVTAGDTFTWNLLEANPDGTVKSGGKQISTLINITPTGGYPDGKQTVLMYIINSPLDQETYTWAGNIKLGSDGSNVGFNNTNNLVEIEDSANGTSWVGGQDNKWTRNFNWTAEAPNSTSEVFIENNADNYPRLTTNRTVNSMIINSGASIITSSSSINITGTITYRRNLPTDGWYLMSSPVSGQTLSNFISSNSLATGVTNTSFRGVGEYKNDGSNWNYYLSTYSGSDEFDNGKGFAVKRSAAGDIYFTGTFSQGTKEFTISQGTNNFNLVGNPYVAYVQLSNFFTANNATDRLSEQTIWMYDPTANNGAGDYVQKMSGTDGAFQIAPGQAFFVSAGSAASNKVTFNSTNLQPKTSDTFLRSSRPEIHLNIGQGDLQSQAKIYYINGTTTGFDNGYDGSVFGGVNYDVSIYSKLVTNDDGRKLGIQSLPPSEYENMIIPIGVKAKVHEKMVFTANVINLPEDMNVFLEDRQEGIFTNLKDNNGYEITSTQALNGSGRFYIHTTTNSTLSTQQDELNGVQIYKINASILRISNLKNIDATFLMNDINGKTIIKKNFKSNNGVQDISISKLSKGFYIIQLQTEAGKLNKKIILE